jgi:deoxycytidine triphosphate deaminase
MQKKSITGTLSGKQLEAELKSDAFDTLTVTPILDWNTQVGQIGIDLRLANQFIVFRRQNFAVFDALSTNQAAKSPYRYQEEIVVPFAQRFILHPGEMVLGSTFEYISMPLYLEGSIEGRSSWARIGLVNAAAVSIDPGYRGCITLELANLSHVPLALYPGSRIGQLVCRGTSDSSSYSTGRKYTCPIGPEYTRLSRDEDIGLLNPDTEE